MSLPGEPPTLELAAVTTKETLEEVLGLTNRTEGSDWTLKGDCAGEDRNGVRRCLHGVGWSGKCWTWPERGAHMHLHTQIPYLFLYVWAVFCEF